MSTVGDWGEFKLIAEIAKGAYPPPEGAVGIGDDCAVLPVNEQKSYLLSTDILSEGVHFLTTLSDPETLGAKSLEVNLSDIAAMGGYPLHCLIALAIPKATPIEWLQAFLRGFLKGAHTHAVSVIGGDTTRSQGGIHVTVTVVGEVHPKHCCLRSRARLGDVVCVTGFLGDSGAGLDCLKGGICSTALISAHKSPKAQLRYGQWLASRTEVHAMMDLSDGLYSDLHRLMESSVCGFTISLNDIPLSTSLIEQKLPKPPLHYALFGGEDYQLLLTVAEESWERCAKDFQEIFNKPLYRIGRVTASQKLLFSGPDEQEVLKGRPFSHFA